MKTTRPGFRVTKQRVDGLLWWLWRAKKSARSLTMQAAERIEQDYIAFIAIDYARPDLVSVIDIMRKQRLIEVKKGCSKTACYSCPRRIQFTSAGLERANAAQPSRTLQTYVAGLTAGRPRLIQLLHLVEGFGKDAPKRLPTHIPAATRRALLARLGRALAV